MMKDGQEMAITQRLQHGYSSDEMITALTRACYGDNWRDAARATMMIGETLQRATAHMMMMRRREDEGQKMAIEDPSMNRWKARIKPAQTKWLWQMMPKK